MQKEILNLLEKADIKPTVNRMLVAGALHASRSPKSLIELETELETLERSSILRVLHLLLERDVIHSFEDGRGVTKYEICHGDSHCTPDDMHAHFYCEKCEQVYCFENISVPHTHLPPGFEIKSVNYMIKGVCPQCKIS